MESDTDEHNKRSVVYNEFLHYVVKKYNSSIDKSENIISVFEKIGIIAKMKGVKFESVFIWFLCLKRTMKKKPFGFPDCL